VKSAVRSKVFVWIGPTAVTGATVIATVSLVSAVGYSAHVVANTSVDKKNQLDVTFCILYFSSNSCSTCFGQPCAHHQELTTA